MTATVQSRDALAKANQIRVDRAAIKRDLKALGAYEARRRVADLLENRPDCILSMRVAGLLTTCRQVGRVFAKDLFLRPAGVSEQLRVRDLSERQTAMLTDLLRTRHRKDQERTSLLRDAERVA